MTVPVPSQSLSLVRSMYHVCPDPDKRSRAAAVAASAVAAAATVAAHGQEIAGGSGRPPGWWQRRPGSRSGHNLCTEARTTMERMSRIRQALVGAGDRDPKDRHSEAFCLSYAEAWQRRYESKRDTKSSGEDTLLTRESKAEAALGSLVTIGIPGIAMTTGAVADSVPISVTATGVSAAASPAISAAVSAPVSATAAAASAAPSAAIPAAAAAAGGVSAVSATTAAAAAAAATAAATAAVLPVASASTYPSTSEDRAHCSVTPSHEAKASGHGAAATPGIPGPWDTSAAPGLGEAKRPAGLVVWPDGPGLVWRSETEVLAALPDWLKEILHMDKQCVLAGGAVMCHATDQSVVDYDLFLVAGPDCPSDPEHWCHGTWTGRTADTELAQRLRRIEERLRLAHLVWMAQLPEASELQECRECAGEQPGPWDDDPTAQAMQRQIRGAYWQDMAHRVQGKRRRVATDILVTRSHRAVTYRIGPRIGGAAVQVVLCLFPSVARVIYGFDRGACALAVADGASRILCTEAACFVLQHDADPVDLANARGRHGERTQRYYRRGVGLVLPDLDLTPLTETVLAKGLSPARLAAPLDLQECDQALRIVQLGTLALRLEALNYTSGDAVGQMLGWRIQGVEPYYEDSEVVEEHNLAFLAGDHHRPPVAQGLLSLTDFPRSAADIQPCLDPCSWVTYARKRVLLAMEVGCARWDLAGTPLWRSLLRQIPDRRIWFLMASSPEVFAACIDGCLRLWMPKLTLPLAAQPDDGEARCQGPMAQRAAEAQWYGKYAGPELTLPAVC